MYETAHTDERRDWFHLPLIFFGSALSGSRSEMTLLLLLLAAFSSLPNLSYTLFLVNILGGTPIVCGYPYSRHLSHSHYKTTIYSAPYEHSLGHIIEIHWPNIYIPFSH